MSFQCYYLRFICVLAFCINRIEFIAGQVTPETEELTDILQAKIQPLPEKSIFFLETSDIYLPTDNSNNLVNLNARQACSVESTALHNPIAKVFLIYVTSSNKLSKNNTDSYIRALSAYDNVHIRQMNLWSFVEGTPVEQWLKTGQLFHSNFLTEHSADLLRLLVLWRFGGTYLDLDVITLRSLSDLPLNYIGRDIGGINNAVINSDINGSGHQIVSECLAEFQAHFNGSIWSVNGPGLIRRILIKHCASNDLYEKGCNGFKIYSPEAFYPVYWRNWDEYFVSAKMNATLSKIKNSYLVHIWNKVSKVAKAEKLEKPNSAYSYLAQAHCPLVYNAIHGKYF